MNRVQRAKVLQEMAVNFFRRNNGERFTVESLIHDNSDIYHIHLVRRIDWRRFGYGFDGSTDDMARSEFRAILDSIDGAIAALDVLGA